MRWPSSPAQGGSSRPGSSLLQLHAFHHSLCHRDVSPWNSLFDSDVTRCQIAAGLPRQPTAPACKLIIQEIGMHHGSAFKCGFGPELARLDRLRLVRPVTSCGEFPIPLPRRQAVEVACADGARHSGTSRKYIEVSPGRSGSLWRHGAWARVAGGARGRGAGGVRRYAALGIVHGLVGQPVGFPIVLAIHVPNRKGLQASDHRPGLVVQRLQVRAADFVLSGNLPGH